MAESLPDFKENKTLVDLVNLVEYAKTLDRLDGILNIGAHKRLLFDRCGFDTFWETYYQPWSAPEWDDLVGYEFNGYNISPLARLFGVAQFRKGFFEADGRMLGYNLFMQQNGIRNEWAPKKGANPRGFFEVEFGVGEHPHAMRINYRKGKVGLFHDPLMDYVLQHPYNPDLLVGLAYWSVFGWHLGKAGFFVLERAEEIPNYRQGYIDMVFKSE